MPALERSKVVTAFEGDSWTDSCNPCIMLIFDQAQSYRQCAWFKPNLQRPSFIAAILLPIRFALILLQLNYYDKKGNCNTR